MPSAAVETGERCGAIDAAVLAVDETLPADLLQERELEVGPRPTCSEMCSR